MSFFAFNLYRISNMLKEMSQKPDSAVSSFDRLFRPEAKDDGMSSSSPMFSQKSEERQQTDPIAWLVTIAVILVIIDILSRCGRGREKAISADPTTEVETDDDRSTPVDVACDNTAGKDTHETTLFNDNNKTLTYNKRFLVRASQDDSPEKLQSHKRIFKRARPINKSASEVSVVRDPGSFNLENTDTALEYSVRGGFRYYRRKNSSSIIGVSFDEYPVNYTGPTCGQVQLSRETDDTDSSGGEVPRKRRRYEGFKTLEEPVCLRYSRERAYDLGDIGRHNTKYLLDDWLICSRDVSSVNKKDISAQASELLLGSPAGRPKKGQRFSQKWVQTKGPKSKDKATQTSGAPNTISQGLQTWHSWMPRRDAQTSTSEDQFSAIEALTDVRNMPSENVVRCEPGNGLMVMKSMIPNTGPCREALYDWIRARIMTTLTGIFIKVQIAGINARETEVD